MFRIGDFSRLARVTVKALRHYERLGLLLPEYTDPVSGYRYYTAAQAPRLERILALKDLGFSLEQVGHLLDADLSPAQLRGMLLIKKQEVSGSIEAEQARLERIEARLRELEGVTPAGRYEVTLARVEAQRVASLRAVLPRYPAVGALFGELYAYRQQHGLRASAWTAVWHDGEYREAAIHAEATFATDDALPPHGSIGERQLPAVETMACTRHHGPVTEIGAAHAALMGWIAAHDYRLAGPTRTLPLRFAGPQSADGITEIQYPVARNGNGGGAPGRPRPDVAVR